MYNIVVLVNSLTTPKHKRDTKKKMAPKLYRFSNEGNIMYIHYLKLKGNTNATKKQTKNIITGGTLKQGQKSKEYTLQNHVLHDLKRFCEAIDSEYLKA